MGRLGLIVVPPIVAAALMIGVFAAAARASHVPLFNYDTWIKWDSGHYLSIANDGYAFMSCAELAGYDPSQWCGNSGWFPGYPYLLRAFHALTGQPTILLAVILSQLFAALSLGVVWNLFLQRKNGVVLALAAFAPGTYYFLVGFPVSMAVCFTLIAIWAWRTDRRGLAYVTGAIAAFTYPSMVWLSAVFALDLVVKTVRGGPGDAVRSARPKSRELGAWLTAAGPAIGFVAVLLLHQMTVGRWNAFFLTQDKYGHGVYFPLSVLVDRAIAVWAFQPVWWRIGLQSLLAAALVVAVVVTLVREARRGQSLRGDLAIGLYALTFWLVPLVLGRVSPYRAEALLVPAAVVAARFSIRLRVALLAPAIVIWFLMATQFVEGRLP